MFCTVKGFERLGFGKIIDVDHAVGLCNVEYFSSPGESLRDVRTVPSGDVVTRLLGANTRIYHYDAEDGTWSVGRVITDLDGSVEVRFSNQHDVLCEYSEVFVRCKRPIDDPVSFLAQGITETPQYAEARSLFFASYIRQRGAVWGLSALLSSVIELEPHQISVVRRILNDAVQRYLLADEVGLGKTIEAGVVIRQAVLDSPNAHKIVVLVPRVLIPQWRDELRVRFGLGGFLDSSVFIIAHDELLEEIDDQLSGASMLVIDEAHHVANEGDDHFLGLFDALCRHASSIDRLLLLSATPVLRNEAGFLRMLHLLDPWMYSLDDTEMFRKKIQHRQVLAETVAMLEPENALFLNGVLDSLNDLFPDDDRLREVIDQLRPLLVGLPDESDPRLINLIRQLRSHLSETYRLHRRILRNRRKQVQGVTPDREGSRCIECTGLLDELESMIENWRIEATIHSSSEIYRRFHWELLCALMSNPFLVRQLCDDRIEAIGSGGDAFSNEVRCLEQIASSIDANSWFENRLEALETLIRKYIDGGPKLVVFCSDVLIADKIAEQLSGMFIGAILRHEVPNEDDEEGVSPATAFNHNQEIRVIVCDYSAEEGLNLQGRGKVVVHFDLPLSPNRIEQRIGRVDRYGAGDPVLSVVILDQGSKYQAEWYAFMSTALGVFDRSISSLQYLIEEELSAFRSVVYDEGLDALIALTERLGGDNGVVVREMKRIDAQEALDELMPMAEEDFDKIFEVDDDWTGVRDATTYWAVDTLLFKRVSERQAYLDNLIDPPFRFQYRIPGGGGVATLVPLSGFLNDFTGVIDFECPRANFNSPMSYLHCSRRQSAVRAGCRILRYGDEFVEALKTFSDMDDRGRSFALWRHMKQGYNDDGFAFKLFFCFDFFVEANLADVEAVLEEFQMDTVSTRTAVRRRGDYLFPPFVHRVWVDEDCGVPSESFIQHFLKLPYDKSGLDSRYKDVNLRPTRLRQLMEGHQDVFENWQLRCERVRDAAKTLFMARPILAEMKRLAFERAQNDDDVRYAQLRSRIESLTGGEKVVEQGRFDSEMCINTELHHGIKHPTVKIDVAGVVILSTRPYAVQQSETSIG